MDPRNRRLTRRDWLAVGLSAAVLGKAAASKPSAIMPRVKSVLVVFTAAFWRK